jgi:hypothetical protein
MTTATSPGPTLGASFGGGLATPAPGSVRLAGEHFAAGLIYLLAGSAGLVWIAPELSAGMYVMPHVAGITHLFTLGWLTTTILGALYQLLPVALGAPIKSVRAGHASFWTFAPGVGLFAAGVASSSTMLHHAGIALVAIGILLALGNLGASLAATAKHDTTWAGIAIALCFLASTLVLGILLLHNLHTGFLGAARIRVLAAHLHIALVGWVLVMIVGVSFRLLPMFLLAHGADTRWAGRALALLATGVPALAVGLLAGVPLVAWLGLIAMDAGFACFLRQAWAFYRVRIRKRIDIGMRFARAGLGFLCVSAILGPFVLTRGVASPRLATAYVAIGLLGGLVLFVIGFFYKIVPLLAWTVHYRDRMGRSPVPTVADTFSARVATVQLRVMAAALLVLGLGIGTASAHVTRCAAVLYAAGVLLLATQIGRVALGRKS